MFRYFIWASAVFLLLVLLIILIFHGGKSKAPLLTSQQLIGYASTDAVARLTIDGPINADQNHQAVEINVGKNSVTFEQLSGYNGQVVNLQTFVSTEAAYNVFLHALALAGFTNGNSSPSASNDLGYCPLGDRYVFEFNYNGNDLQRYWSTSCGGLGTYSGNLGLTLTLFQAQVPNYDTLVQNVTF